MKKTIERTSKRPPCSADVASPKVNASVDSLREQRGGDRPRLIEDKIPPDELNAQQASTPALTSGTHDEASPTDRLLSEKGAHRESAMPASPQGASPALDVKSPKVAEYLDVGLGVDEVPKGASPPSLEFLRAMKWVCDSEGLEMKPELLQRLNTLEDQERRRSQPAGNSISPCEREARIARIRELQRHPLPMPQHVAAMLSDAVLRKK